MNSKHIGTALLLAVMLCAHSVCFALTDQTPEPTPEPTPVSADETEMIPDRTLADTLQFEPQEGLDSVVAWTVFDASGEIADYHRNPKELIHMPAGDEYTRMRLGVLTHRNNAFRQNASAGKVEDPSGLEVLWKTDTLPSEDNPETAAEWTGQPAIARWSIQVREASDLFEEKKNKTALKEVIVPGADGRIWFLDLEDGKQTREAADPGMPVAGTPCLAPNGIPYLAVQTSGLGADSFLQYNLYTGERMPSAGNREQSLLFEVISVFFPTAEDPAAGFFGDFTVRSSPVIDRISDTLITAGGNGELCLVSMNSSFDYRTATFEISPSCTAMRASVTGKETAAVESSLAACGRYVFYADMAGNLFCVDTDSLSPVWTAETGDAVLSAVALDSRKDGELDLYTANTLSIRESGDATVRRFNALNGKEVWCRNIGVEKDPESGTASGFAASPVIGEGKLGGLVFYTVTGLNDEGRKTLDAAEGTKAAVIALDKGTGEIRWVSELQDGCISSPTAIYDDKGNGWIIQCERNGTVLLIEGLTGYVTAYLCVDGEIMSSPAIYNDVMVVRTTGGSTGAVYGIHILSGQEPE